MIPVFIGGTGRSGTTVVKQYMVSRPEFVGFRSELRIIIDPDGVLDLIKTLDEDWSPYKGDIALKRFRRLLEKARSTSIPKRFLRRACYAANFSPPSYLALDLENDIRSGIISEIFDPVLSELSLGVSEGIWAGSPGGHWSPGIDETRRWPRSRSTPILSTALRRLFEQLPGAENAKAFVEDTPFNILHGRELFELFPDMYLLNIYRDPRDIVSSYIGKEWGGKDIKLTGLRIREILDRWNEVRESLPRDRVFEISLDKLAANPAEALSPFLEAINISSEGMDNIISVDKANIGRWRNGLTAAQVRDIEEFFPTKDRN